MATIMEISARVEELRKLVFGAGMAQAEGDVERFAEYVPLLGAEIKKLVVSFGSLDMGKFVHGEPMPPWPKPRSMKEVEATKFDERRDYSDGRPPWLW